MQLRVCKHQRNPRVNQRWTNQEKPEGQSGMDKSRETGNTQDSKTKNTTQQHTRHKTAKQKTQHTRQQNKKRNTQDTRQQNKKHNTICVAHHFMQTNTNNVNISPYTNS